MKGSWITDEVMGAKLSPCGNFSAKKVNAEHKEQVWELTNYITDEVTYHPTFSECKKIAEGLTEKKEK